MLGLQRGYSSIIGYLLAVFWDTAKENGNCYSIMGYIHGVHALVYGECIILELYLDKGT